MNPVFFTIKPNLFGGRFFFYFGPLDRMAELRTWYEAHGIADVHHRIRDFETDGRPDTETFSGMVFDPFPAHPLLVLPCIPHTPEEIGNLVHEIHHAVQRWTEAIGIFTTRDSEEVFAYVEGELTRHVLEYLWHGTVAAGMETSDDYEL